MQAEMLTDRERYRLKPELMAMVLTLLQLNAWGMFDAITEHVEPRLSTSGVDMFRIDYDSALLRLLTAVFQTFSDMVYALLLNLEQIEKYVELINQSPPVDGLAAMLDASLVHSPAGRESFIPPSLEEMQEMAANVVKH